MTLPGPTVGEPTDDELTAPRPRSVGHRILSGVLTYGVVLLAFVYLSRNISLNEWQAALGDISVPMVVVSVLLGIVILVAHWPPTVIALPGLRLRESAVTNTASAALSNSVPEGGAIATGLNYAMLRSWGFGLGDITSEVLVTGTWSQLTKFTLLAVSLGVVWAQGWGPPNTSWAALVLIVLVGVAIVLLAVILRSQRFALRLGHWGDDVTGWIRRRFARLPSTDLSHQVPTFRSVMVQLLRTCWIRLTVAELVAQLVVVLTLGICCRMQGVDESVLPWSVILTAWGMVTFASLLVPTPGGLGVAEVVLLGVLGYGLPTSMQPALLAAILLYRIATFLVPIPIGLATYVYWRTSDSWRHTPGTRGPTAMLAAEPPSPG